MFEIDWTTEEDRKRHRTKASTIHGWLRMWRGTLAGNERVRQQGRYEMKVARALREYKQKQKQAQAAGGNSGPLALFNFGSLSKRRNAAPKPQRHKSSSSKHHRSGGRSRPSAAKRKDSHHSRHGSGSARPAPTRHRSSHSAKNKPRASRQASGRR